jgi:hypothetical protein
MIREPLPCPASGAGVHSWILATANRYRIAGMSEAEAERRITEAMTRRPSPANEVITAVRKAYTSAWTPGSTTRWTRLSLNRSPVPITVIKFDMTKLRAMAEKVRMPSNWRHWLWERSPKRPEVMNSYSFLAHLYQSGERVLVFDKMDSTSPIATVGITCPMDCRVPEFVQVGGNYGLGVWYLSNPVDGGLHPNPRNEGKLSCRSEEAVTSFRYAVLESDQAPVGLWLAFIVQLPLRVSAIYLSGGRSVHCLFRVDATSKAHWDSIIAPLKRPLKVLGGDAGALSAVRLTRLPQCWRPEKNGFQRLLYLCPNPPPVSLIDLPAIHSRPWALARWLRDCRRWNPKTEAFQ